MKIRFDIANNQIIINPDAEDARAYGPDDKDTYLATYPNRRDDMVAMGWLEPELASPAQ